MTGPTVSAIGVVTVTVVWASCLVPLVTPKRTPIPMQTAPPVMTTDARTRIVNEVQNRLEYPVECTGSSVTSVMR